MDLGEPSRLEVRLHRPPGDERDAVSGGNSGADGLLEPEHEAGPQVAQLLALSAQLVLDELTHAGSLLHHDQRPLAKLVQRDGAARKPVLRWADEDHSVAEERRELDRPVPASCSDDAELELPLGDEGDDRLRVVHGELDA